MNGAEEQSFSSTVCDQCGKSLPSTNHFLHRLRCTGTKEDNDEKEEDLSTVPQNTQTSEISTPMGWNCRHCTFLNETDSFLGDSDFGRICAMCHFNQDDEGYDCTADVDEEDDLRSSDDDLPCWTCSHCTIVNDERDDRCQVCCMPRRPSHADPSVPSFQSQSSSRIHSALESTIPALTYLGLTVGAMMTDPSRGSSTRARNGLIGSVLGTVAGMAIALYSTSQDSLFSSTDSGESSGSVDVDQLPVHRYQSEGILRNDHQVEEVTCRICMEEYQQGDPIKSLKCFHMFHANCLDKWLARKQSCPLCNTPL